jgi:hypothetical protein
MLDELITYNARHAGMRYSLGHHDCFLYAVRWADLMRSERVRDLYRYQGNHGAKRVLIDAGVAKAGELLERHYARTSDPYPGDLVAWAQGDRLGSCGIYAGDGMSYTVDTAHPGVVLTDEPHSMAWRI